MNWRHKLKTSEVLTVCQQLVLTAFRYPNLNENATCVDSWLFRWILVSGHYHCMYPVVIEVIATICDPAWKHRTYVHKIHHFILFNLSHLMCSINCIEFPIVCCTFNTSLIGKISLHKKLWNFKVQKVVKFYVHVSPIFSFHFTYIRKD